MSPNHPESALRAYPGGEKATTVVPPEAATGFSGAQIFQVCLENQLYCLRRWPASGLAPMRIRGLHRLLRTVADFGGPPIPVPLCNRDGSTLTKVDQHWWQLEPWMPGQANFHQNPTPQRLTAAMQALARWHRAATHFQPQPNEIKWFASHSGARSPAVVERLARLTSYTSQFQAELQRSLRDGRGMDTPEQNAFCDLGLRVLTAAQSMIPRMHQELHALRNTRFRLQPCLRDVWHDHVLFLDESVSGLIDASACRYDHVATDIARLVASLVSEDPSGWDTALQAYQSERTLDLDGRVLVSTLDRSGTLLSCLSWIRRFAESGLPVQQFPAVSRRIRVMVERLELWVGRR
ncbi:MAG: phosphotransferase [Planctomycetaceae bacterium]